MYVIEILSFNAINTITVVNVVVAMVTVVTSGTILVSSGVHQQRSSLCKGGAPLINTGIFFFDAVV